MHSKNQAARGCLCMDTLFLEIAEDQLYDQGSLSCCAYVKICLTETGMKTGRNPIPLVFFYVLFLNE